MSSRSRSASRPASRSCRRTRAATSGSPAPTARCIPRSATAGVARCWRSRRGSRLSARTSRHPRVRRAKRGERPRALASRRVVHREPLVSRPSQANASPPRPAGRTVSFRAPTPRRRGSAAEPYLASTGASRRRSAPASMPTPVTLIPGDGIGPSIADATVRVLEAAGAQIEWDVQQAGQAGVTAHGDPMPDATLASITRTKLALKGPLETPVGKGFRSVNVALRKSFDLYANVRPARSLVGSRRHYDNLDLVL